ncbi:MAG: PQQ-binding-like beta-propeller repeat protein, partial [Spirochaetales bacterium]|nr:PQQ-binding-like beta-propeller repeat protein [Spirochaetales bacterium]
MKTSFIKTAACILILSAIASCSGGSDWVQFRGEGGRGASSTRISPPLGLKWKFQLQLDGRTLHSFNPPVVKGDTIYFGSADGNFYALDIESGYMRWVFKTGAPINSVPYADDDQVYFGSQDGKTYAVSREEGLEIWNFPTDRQVNSSVERYKDYIIFTSDGGASFFLSPQGEKMFHIPNPVWYNHTYQMYDDIMYFAPGPMSRPHSFGPYDINQQRHLWILDTSALDAIWYSFPAIRNYLIFFSTLGYDGTEWYLSFYAYDRMSGQRVWEYQDFSRWGPDYVPHLEELLLRGLNLLDFMAPAVWDDLVIYTGGDAVVRAFDADTGNIRWEKEFDTPISSAPTLAGDRLYFGLLSDGEVGFFRTPGDNPPPAGSAPRLV